MLFCFLYKLISPELSRSLFEIDEVTISSLCSYYRRFIKDFSKKAKPLYKLLEKDIPYKWSNKQQKTFKWLKQCLTKDPILSHPNFEKEFILITDASADGFKIITDHVAFKSLLNEKVPKGRYARWIIKLQQYDFFVEYRSEKKNSNADTQVSQNIKGNKINNERHLGIKEF
ncbi:unnamed protein product [Rhizophagus irregularis]|nr:unnamed protein product [Rhizophagus irregularis]